MAVGIFNMLQKGAVALWQTNVIQRGTSAFFKSRFGKYATGITAAVGVGAVSGKGLVSLTGDVAEMALLDEEKRGKGFAKGATEQGLDTVLGDGTADSVKNAVTEGVTAMKDAAVAMKEAAKSGKESVQQMLHVQGNTQYAVNPYVGADGYYPQQTMYNGGVGAFTNLFQSIPQMVGNATGANVTAMNLAGLIGAATLMFGRFGWMGKALSLLFGNMALKSMQQGRGVYPAVGQGYGGQYYGQPMQQQYYPSQPVSAVQDVSQENVAEHRMRRS